MEKLTSGPASRRTSVTHPSRHMRIAADLKCFVAFRYLNNGKKLEGLTPATVEWIKFWGGDTTAFKCNAAALITETASAAFGSAQNAECADLRGSSRLGSPILRSEHICSRASTDFVMRLSSWRTSWSMFVRGVELENLLDKRRTFK